MNQVIPSSPEPPVSPPMPPGMPWYVTGRGVFSVAAMAAVGIAVVLVTPRASITTALGHLPIPAAVAFGLLALIALGLLIQALLNAVHGIRPSSADVDRQVGLCSQIAELAIMVGLAAGSAVVGMQLLGGMTDAKALLPAVAPLFLCNAIAGCLAIACKLCASVIIAMQRSES